MTDDVAGDRAMGDAKRVAEAGLLTEREAQAWVLVEVHGWDVPAAADEMSVSESRVYNARSAASDDLDAARETLQLLDRLGAGDGLSPAVCAGCGDGLSSWTVADGHVVCPDCAGIDDS